MKKQLLLLFAILFLIPAHTQPAMLQRGYAALQQVYEGVPTSVLSSGKWVKLRIKKTGVYKLTAGTLSKWGFKNPAAVSVWSNGCSELPRDNNSSVLDDLAQLPTQLSNNTIFFYAEATNTWTYDTQKKLHKHVLNEFDDAAYIYITDGKSPFDISSVAQAANATDETDTYDYRDYHERIDTNLLRSGRCFFGEVFKKTLQRTFSFSIPSLYTNAPQLKLQICAGMNSESQALSYTVTVNGSSVNTLTIPPKSTSAVMSVDTALFENIPVSSEKLDVSITFNKPGNPFIWGVLDFLIVNARANLRLQNNQLLFRDINTVGAGKVTKFKISTTQNNVKVWDVTDLHNVQEVAGVSTSGNALTVPTATLREFVAFTEGMAMEPEYLSGLDNQDLHSKSPAELVIVAHPDFKSQADRVAQFHQKYDNMSVLVVTTEQVYNEFSSGIADVGSIRNFMRMFWRRNQSTAPKYLLLFGSGSYINYQGKKGVGCIPTFQSDNSLVSTSSYVSDDFFVLLDDNEYLNDAGMIGKLDMAVGRFPVYNATQANTLANKLDKYYSDFSGDWMSKCIIIADDEDGNEHMNQAEKIGNYIMDTAPSYYVNKIYFDAYEQISTPHGERYPDVTEAINSAMGAGALLVNYTGHANDEWLAHEQVITIPDIENWSNRNRLPVFVTATCEFSRFDNPWLMSAGEHILFLDKGGSIAMLSTTRLVFSSANYMLNMQFIRDFLSLENGNHLRLGEMVRRTKNSTSTGVNQLNFSLLGDPALMLLFPTLKANTTAVNSITYISASSDTLRALARSNISGEIAQSNLKDTIVITVFDKEKTKKTLGNGGQTPFAYRDQSTLVYKGKVTTPNGTFIAKFVVPQDITPQYGKGKITYVGKAGSKLVAGSNPVPVGGIATNPVVDSIPPNVRMYMNSERWVPGGTVNDAPTFIALLNDSSGINTTGNGVGRDITLKLVQSNKTYTLNNYYTANTDSYTSGRIEFPIPPMGQGRYTATLKVWDVANNSTEQSVEYVVANEDVFTINRLLNYPNPFTQKTAFFFEHNRPYNSMDVLIQVFTITGKLVKTIRYTIPESSSLRTAPIEWDGRDDYGGKLGRGTYLYKAKVRCSNGESAERLEKLVVLN